MRLSTAWENPSDGPPGAAAPTLGADGRRGRAKGVVPTTFRRPDPVWRGRAKSGSRARSWRTESAWRGRASVFSEPILRRRRQRAVDENASIVERLHRASLGVEDAQGHTARLMCRVQVAAVALVADNEIVHVWRPRQSIRFVGFGEGIEVGRRRGAARAPPTPLDYGAASASGLDGEKEGVGAALACPRIAQVHHSAGDVGKPLGNAFAL